MGVLNQLQKWVVVLALVVSIGGHWAFLQSVAWVGMAVNYSKNATLSQALEKTFDGHHLCKLCKVVRAGQKAENSDEVKIELKKFDLATGTPTLFVFESPAVIPQIQLGPILTRTEVPLLPPPLLA
ncbi:MAG: hypothetical protein JWO95_1567 [Verrucomicrobiales bacterium]|nr:hypothetical protein [Verrucomicrobiales bacterium]